jgi:transposase
LATLEFFVSSPSKRSSASESSETESQPHPLLTLSAPQASLSLFPQRRRFESRGAGVPPTVETGKPTLGDRLSTGGSVSAHGALTRTGEQLDAWLGAVQASHLKAFQSFVTGVQQDKDAVLAGLTLPWSNGPVEGQVNRLKLIKRSMYGRAKFDLLKLRVLHHDKKSLERKNKKKQAQQEEYLKTPRVRKKNTTFEYTTIDISKVA